MGNSLAIDPGPFTQAIRMLAERDIRIAATWALNDTADEALKSVQDRMNVAFDRPTRFTQNAFYATKARSSKLEAAVVERPTRAARDYLSIQEQGGPRPQTGFEAQLSRSLAYEGHIQSVIPADEARLDAHGNWSMGERNQVMSALKIQRDYASNATARSTLRGRKRGRVTYFVPQSGLHPGIYRKTADGSIGIVAVISDKVPVYQQRLGFYEETNRVYADRFAAHMSRTFSKMIGKRFG